MAIAQLTHLHISIPASESPPGAVPEECFPSVPLPRVSADPHFRQCDYSSGCCPGLGAVAVASIEVSDVPVPVLPPPPGFERFCWPAAIGRPGGDPFLYNFSTELTG